MSRNSEFSISESRGGPIGWWRIAAIVMLAWTLAGLLSASAMYANSTDERWRFPLRRILELTMYNAWLMAALTIPLLMFFAFVVRRIHSRKRRLAAYIFALPVYVVLHVAIRPFVVPFVLSMNTPTKTYRYVEKAVIGFRSFYVSDTWIFCCIAFAFLAWRLTEETRLRALREERLQTKLARAELQVLKMQLQPHFLFNTLNTIYNLAPQNSRKAQLMISRLADLLRLSLDHVSTNTVPLQRELEFLNNYIEIEKTRFEERLNVQMDVDPETLNALVPNMILQPLVENAIRHGVGKKAAGGTVTIAAHRSGDRLELSITDDGRLSPMQSGSGGIGLANIRARLTQLYSGDYHFELTPGVDGTRAVLELPFQRAIAEVETNEVL